MMEPNADADASPYVEVTIAGGRFGQAVVGTQIINRNTTVHQHAANVDGTSLPPGQFILNSQIIVYENDPISRDSRIYRAKLHSEILGDLEIAVKILSDGERQRRESQIHFKVPHHKNIVERILTNAFKYQGQSCIYIAMEQCYPQNLYAYVVSLSEKNAPYDAEMFLLFAFQIATGLEFLHRHKILNRDLKPENILLSADKKVAKIADFGMSKEMTGEASTVSALQPGTDGWRSPEILKNAKRITLATDMFSLGLIFHFLWSYGKHAFGDDPHAWNLYIKRGMNMTLDGLKISNSTGAKRLLKSLLSRNPAYRPSALEVLRDRIFEGPRLQSDSAAIYCNITDGKAKRSVASRSKGTPEATNKTKSIFGKFWKSLDRKSGTEENSAIFEDKEKNDSTFDTSEDKTDFQITDMGGFRRIFEDVGQTLTVTHDFQLGKQWEVKGAEEYSITYDGDEENDTPEGTEDDDSIYDIPTDKTIVGIVAVKRNLQQYGIRVRRFMRDFELGKEWEGEFCDQKVTITQYFESDWKDYENAVDVLKDLKHENIVHFIKEVPAFCIILTEFPVYGTLGELLRINEKFTVFGAEKQEELTNLLRISAQIASGMDFLHRKKYIHCDLRAGNVVVTANSVCKISGFSLAQHVEQRGGFILQPDESMASIEWAAQEAFTGGLISFKSDVWSFGVLLWEMFTKGRTLYPGMSTEEIGQSICAGHRMLKPKLCPSRLYFDIMRPCWVANPDARPTFEFLEKSLLSYDVEEEEKGESVTVRALFHHITVGEDKLCLKRGDIIVDCMEHDDGTQMQGTLAGKTGYFPSNCVVQIKGKET